MSQPSLLVVPSQIGQGKLFAYSPLVGAPVEFGVTRATTAIRTDASGLLASVASGIARIDYGVTGCPTLLVEPSATNLVLRSEEFDNAAWTKAGTTISANSTTAPDGTSTADSLVLSLVSGVHSCVQFNRWPASTQATASFYVKANTANRVYIANFSNGVGAFFNLASGTVEGVIGAMTATITAINNGYYRITATHTAAASQTFGIGIYQTFTGNYITSTEFTPSAANSVFIWGAQLETGSVATSYIPTVASTVTRNADVISLASGSSYIGQTEGTLYAEIDTRITGGSAAKRTITISDGTDNNRINIGKSAADAIVFGIIIAGVAQAAIETAINRSGRIKMAAAYAANDAVFYVNGTQVGVDTSFTLPASLSQINIGSNAVGTAQLNDRIRAAALYKTRLSNAELAQLTSL